MAGTPDVVADNAGLNKLGWANHVILKECYEKEGRTQLHWWMAYKKYLQPEAGEPKRVEVMRRSIMGATPHPGGYFTKVYTQLLHTHNCSGKVFHVSIMEETRSIFDGT